MAIAIIAAEETVHPEIEVIAPNRADPDLIANKDQDIEKITHIETIDLVHMTREKDLVLEITTTHLIKDKTTDRDLEVTHPQGLGVTLS